MDDVVDLVSSSSEAEEDASGEVQEREDSEDVDFERAESEEEQVAEEEDEDEEEEEDDESEEDEEEDEEDEEMLSEEVENDGENASQTDESPDGDAHKRSPSKKRSASEALAGAGAPDGAAPPAASAARRVFTTGPLAKRPKKEDEEWEAAKEKLKRREPTVAGADAWQPKGVKNLRLKREEQAFFSCKFGQPPSARDAPAAKQQQQGRGGAIIGGARPRRAAAVASEMATSEAVAAELATGGRKKSQAKPREEYGLIRLGYESVSLYNSSGRQLYVLDLVREKKNGGDKHILRPASKKTKELVINTKCGFWMASRFVQVGERVAEDAFLTGDYFLRDHETEHKAQEAKAASDAQQVGSRPKSVLFSGPRPAWLTGAKNKKGTSATASKGAVRKRFVPPLKSAMAANKVERRKTPLHDPDAPKAVVLFRPGSVTSSRVAVVVDPIIGDSLRPHQREGMKFLFESVGLGFTRPQMSAEASRTQQRFYGAILADDMGLGKTIQAIALIWTLLRQGPDGLPLCRRTVVVTPSSLVTNWANEIDHWLKGQLNVVQIADSSKRAPKLIDTLERGAYTNNVVTDAALADQVADVLVISYDQLKRHQNRLSAMTCIDLVICDEGHRLKNSSTKTTQAVRALPASRRVILSGTPVQNDLGEFFAMADFSAPGFLGDLQQFSNTFMEPILRGREPDADDEERSLAKRRSEDLTARTRRFILRRTQQINRQYLPPKCDFAVFCALTDLQRDCYMALCEQYSTAMKAAAAERLHRKSNKASAAAGPTQSTDTLPLITNLKKLCNTPELLLPLLRSRHPSVDALHDVFAKHGLSGAISPASASIKKKGGESFPEWSSKMTFLLSVLQTLNETNVKLRADSKRGGHTLLPEKIVIVSNYTETLTVIARLCEARGFGYFQLDGSTVVKKRQALVDEFNDPSRPEFVFLLSSKAGGCGLNIVGACHLALFDSDWNPANDAQAMARVWRPGQKKRVHLFRLLCTGTIEEKVFQRQISKLALSGSVVEDIDGYDEDPDPDDIQQAEADPDGSSPAFSSAELRELFKYRAETVCDTHDLLACRCSTHSVRVALHVRQQQGNLLDELQKAWDHIDAEGIADPENDSLKHEHMVRRAAKGTATFIMMKETPGGENL
jgi:DNA repair and recombination protein RAD54 and RAD54-like protein